MAHSQLMQESEAHFEGYFRIFQLFPDAVSLLSLNDGRLLDVNDSFEQLTGYRRDELVGCCPVPLVFWLDSAFWQDACRMLEYAGELRDLETRIKLKNGRPAEVLVTLRRLEIGGEPCCLAVFRDVSGRKLVEQALRESEEKFAKAFRATPSILTITTIEEGVFLEVNETFERLTGYSREEAIGHTAQELEIWAIPEDRDRFLELLRRDGMVRGLEASFRRKNGGIIEGMLSAEIIEVDGEQFLLILVNDITDRKLAEEALLVSEGEKSLILNSTLDHVVYYDQEMKVLWGNQKVLDSAGITMEELAGRYCWELWHQRTAPCEGCPVILARDTGVPQEAENRSSDGREWHIRGFPVKGDDGRVTGVVKFSRDITESKRTEYALRESERLLESEKRYRSLFENMLEGVVRCRMLYTADGRPEDFVFLEANSAYLELTGLLDVIGKRVSEVLPGFRESCPELFAGYARVAETGRAEKFESYVKPLALWRSMSVYSTEKGHFVAVSENITERKQIEAELRGSHSKLRELTAHLNLGRERERKEIARTVHDELGTALTLIKFDLAWLKRHYSVAEPAVVERIRGMEDIVHESTKAVQRITSELRPSLLDEQGLAATIEWQVIEFEKRTGISCRLNIDECAAELGQDMAINAFRILQESLSNVMRHARAASVEIAMIRSGERVVLRIADDGVGITDQDISAPASFGILGMEERARLCNGGISIKGIAGKGTTVQVSFPV